MTEFFLHLPPAFILIVGGLLLPFVRHPFWRAGIILLLPFLALLQVGNVMLTGQGLTASVAGFSLQLLQVHPFSLVFAVAFIIAAFAGGLFGLFQAKTAELAAAYIYAGGALGVIFSGDFISLFFFWELMALASAVVIWMGGTPQSKAAGFRYIAMHLSGGVVLMMGIVAHVSLNGNALLVPFDMPLSLLFYFDSMDLSTLSVWFILIGFLINVAAPPFSAWLPDAYPESSPFGAVFLSAFTTKTAVFVLLTLFPGNGLLLYVGLFMIFYGIVMAMLENDMRRILSYSIVNQVGFMVAAIGIGSPLALLGAAAHAFCHIIYKALLFMSAGSVLYVTGKRKCTELGGLWRSMRWTMVCGVIGALSISAFPLTSGFVSKSMISAAAADDILVLVWFLLLAASAGVFLHAGIKFPWFVFFHKESGLKAKDPPYNMRLAMLLLSFLCIVPALPGVAEHTIYRLLPALPDYVSYTTEHVVGQLQLLLFSALAFFVLLPWLQRTDTITLDFDWLYRSPGLSLLRKSWGGLCRMQEKLYQALTLQVKDMWKAFFILHGPEGILSRHWSIGVTLMWILLFLCGYLVLYYS